MSTPNASDIRAWAKQQGLTVSERGRLSQDVVMAYEKAHRTSASPKAPKPTKSARSTTTKAPRAATSKTVPVAQPDAVTATTDPVDTALQQRVADLEQQVLTLTQRLDAAVSTPTRRGRSFSLPRRK